MAISGLLEFWGQNCCTTGCCLYPATLPVRGIFPLGVRGKLPPPVDIRSCFHEWVGVEPTLPGRNLWGWAAKVGEHIRSPFWLEAGDLLCLFLSNVDDLSSAEVPLRTFAIWPRLSPLLRLGKKTGGCSRSVPSSSREPTKITVSQLCSDEDGSVNSDELEANFTSL